MSSLDAFPELGRQAEQLTTRVDAGDDVHVVDGVARSDLLMGVASRLPEAVFVRVPNGATDRAVYTLFSIASKCDGAAGLDTVAGKVRENPSSMSAALDALTGLLGSRPLIVDDIDRLGRADHELRDVLGSTERDVREWILSRARLTGGGTTDPGRPATRPTFGAPEDEVTWKRVEERYESFRLAQARAALFGGEFTRWTSGEIANDVWMNLNDGTRELLAVLLVHERPIARDVIARMSRELDGAVDLAVRATIVTQMHGRVWLAPEWEVLRDVLTPGHARSVRQLIADAFVEAAESTQEPIAILEAHRHLTELGDLPRATKFAEFGALSLLDLARRASLDGDFSRAARTYDAVLSLDARLRQRPGFDGIGDHPRAYAIHYRAYNRYKMEAHGSPIETLESYREALNLWPEHALFWSRTMACCFIAGRDEEGLRARDDAWARVPEHPNKASALVWRTVERLLKRKLVLPALLVWDGMKPNGLQQQDALERLFDATREWSTRELRVPGGLRIGFTDDVTVRFEPSAAGYRASVFDLVGEAARPSEAWVDLGRALSNTVVSALEDADAPPPAWVDRLDERSLSGGDEAARWIRGLLRLRRRPEAQWRRVLRVLAELRAVAPSLRRPTMGPASDESAYVLEWSFTDRPGLTLEIEVAADQSIEWFFREGESFEGSDASVTDLPPRVSQLARRFA